MKDGVTHWVGGKSCPHSASEICIKKDNHINGLILILTPHSATAEHSLAWYPVFNSQRLRLLQYVNRVPLHGRVSNDVNSFGLLKFSEKRIMRLGLGGSPQISIEPFTKLSTSSGSTIKSPSQNVYTRIYLLCLPGGIILAGVSASHLTQFQ